MSSEGTGVFTKLVEQENRGNPISKDRIDMAVCNLYGSWDGFPADSVSFINDALERGNYEAVYAAVMEEEKKPSIRKSERELTLDDIFKDYDGESVAEEFDGGSPVGREVW